MHTRLRYGMRDRIGWIHLDDGKADAIQSDGCEPMQTVLGAAEVDASRVLIRQEREGFLSGMRR